MTMKKTEIQIVVLLLQIVELMISLVKIKILLIGGLQIKTEIKRMRKKVMSSIIIKCHGIYDCLMPPTMLIQGDKIKFHHTH